jgi:hypothetical protein
LTLLRSLWSLFMIRERWLFFCFVNL